MSNRTVLTVVRHGETAANAKAVWCGSMDVPLNARGQSQAEAVGRHLARRYPDAVALYASPLVRARQTAEAIGRATGLSVQTEPGIGEYHIGEWEGMPYTRLHEEHRFWERIKQNPDFTPPGGESVRQLVERFSAGLSRIDAAHRGQRAIVVTHGGALSLTLRSLLSGETGQWYRAVHNCSVSEIVLSPELEILSFDAVEHLEGI